jgi:hypothetical protein
MEIGCTLTTRKHQVWNHFHLKDQKLKAIEYYKGKGKNTRGWQWVYLHLGRYLKTLPQKRIQIPITILREVKNRPINSMFQGKM